jgi:CheY-like chemotaxis protein
MSCGADPPLMNTLASFAAPPDSLRPRETLSRGGRILVVDDEPAVRRFIELALRNAGYEDLLFCHTGTPVPFIARSERPGLIIMDVMMAGGNGMRALRKLKQCELTRDIPVILTSGFNVPTLEESEQNQPDHILAKPFTAPQLLVVVERLAVV